MTAHDNNVLIRLLGRFCIEYKGQEFNGFQQQKVQDLLCYLILHKSKAHPRELLASVFWGDHYSTSQARKYLRNTVWQLQTFLNQHEMPQIINAEFDWIQIDCQVGNIWVDIDEVARAYEMVLDVEGQLMSTEQALTLREVVSVYNGDLLEGCYEEWCLEERVRYRHMHIVLHDKLMGHAESEREYELAISHGEKILAFDRAREITHRRMMYLHFLKGDRTGAIRQFKRCETILKDELDIEPSESTIQLLKRIIQNDIEHESIRIYQSKEAHKSSTSPHSLIESLKRMKTDISRLQDELNWATYFLENSGDKPLKSH